MEPPNIERLDERTVQRIAAGEVVERPASVVKELIENSLDAGATRVSVSVEAGGTEGIRVRDDGVGIPPDQLEATVAEHATSKIGDIEDLDRGVGTLGFRGEALYTVGAVSRLTVRSRPPGADAGAEITVEGGEVGEVRPAGCPEGTTVEVEDLFYNTPARKKFLKRTATEFDRVNTVVTGYALANPDVAVSLTHGDRETFATTGQGDLQATVLSVYGREVARSMIPVDPGELPEGPLDGISGLVSHPETNRASRDYLNTFVNGRYVTANSVRDAVVAAYETQLAPDRYPFAVLDCSVDPAVVDVNVHPRKLEVRFADEEGLRDQVEAAVSAALMREGLLRTGAPRGKSAPDQTEIRPGDVDTGRLGGAATDDGAGPSEADAPSTGDASVPADQPTGPRRVSSHSDDPGDVEHAGRAAGGDDTASPDAAPTGGTPDVSRSRPSSPHDDPARKFRGEGDQARLGDADVEPTADFDSLPAMRVLGQFRETYVVAETADGLVLVDQHAADERVNYERLREQFEGEVTTQALASPVALELTAGEAAVADARTEALARLGFRTEAVDDRTVRVSTVPSLVAEAADPNLLRDVLGSLLSGERTAAGTVEAAADALLADLACYPSITGNTSLTAGSIQDLLAALDDCENPYACPHGRPVLVELADDEIEARFERDYPGHGG